MLFNSALFCLVFFPLVTGLFFVLPHRWRWLLLLAASCWFYMAFVPVYILILAFTIAVDYAAGILIEESTGRRRRSWLIASIVANVGVLVFFKYFNFLNQNIGLLMQQAGLGWGVPDLGIILPIGLSFHTFQSLSYTIEVYRGHQKAERRPGLFALYVMFYPQLVAGPIERPANLLQQLDRMQLGDPRFAPEYGRIVQGLKQMLWGFFKKLVIADRCAVVVNEVFGNTGEHEALALLLGSYLFALQIYCDFSGYTDIALGAARVMGFDLMVNFRTPYRSASISEFWSRWHISLSSWFRDYVYIPLGGNRVVKWRWYYNLLVVFLLSGLWHGAAWTFVVWGALHGGYLVLALVFAPFWKRFDHAVGLDRLPRIKRWLGVIITFHLVVLGWVFFRATSLKNAFNVLEGIATKAWHPGDLMHLLDRVGHGVLEFTVLFGLLFLLVDPWMDAVIKGERPGPRGFIAHLLFAALAVGILIFGWFGSTGFIYFQF
ncbi:MAG TPA: MBOAT family O-acyltransferase [Flavobacteriales bacterium]